MINAKHCHRLPFIRAKRNRILFLLIGVQNYDFRMDKFILSDFQSTFLALWASISSTFVQIFDFVVEHVFLPNESSGLRVISLVEVSLYNIMDINPPLNT